jgi:hypothetical protein
MRASLPEDRDVLWLESQANSSNGPPIRIAWKCWRYIGGPVTCEVRSIAQDFFGKEKDIKLCRIIKDDMASVERLLADTGTSFWKEFIPSHQAYKANSAFYDAQGVIKDHIRDEYSVTTRGVIIWLAAWANTRKKHDEQETARAMLEAFLSARVPAKFFFTSVIINKCNSLFDLCALRNAQDKPCRCVRHMLKDLGDNYGNFDWKEFSDLLVNLAFDKNCDCYRPLFEKLVQGCFSHHVAGMLESDPANILRTARVFETPSGKKRRVDEDFKKELATLNVESGIKPTTLCAFSAMGSDVVAKDCQRSFIKGAQLASQNQLKCEGVVIFCEDGSGHGKPAESTSMSLIWDANANLCSPGIPKVSPMFVNHP